MKVCEVEKSFGREENTSCELGEEHFHIARKKKLARLFNDGILNIEMERSDQTGICQG